MSGFEWQIVDSRSTNEVPTSPLPEAPQAVPAQRFLLVILLAIGLSVVIAQVLHRARLGVTIYEAKVEAEVRATHDLFREIAHRRDEELFYTIISGRDMAWAELQVGLLRDGLLLDRPLFNLRASQSQILAPQNGQPSNLTTSNDHTVVEVRSLQQYDTDERGGMNGWVALERTDVYRRGSGGWLRSSIDSDYWGEWLTLEKKHLIVVFPERDQSIAERLAKDIELTIQQMCINLHGGECPEDLELSLTLDNSAESLRLQDMEDVMTQGSQLVLPTPTLVGTPVNEYGYQVLYRTYASSVIAAAITWLADFECCHRGLFFRAILEKQLSLLELKPWPLTQAGYDQILRRSFRWARPQMDWYTDSLERTDNWRQVYSLVDFLIATSIEEVELLEMQRDLSRARGRYLSWAREFYGRDVGPDEFTTDWLRYVYKNSTSGMADASPLPLPVDQVRLLCADSVSRKSSLLIFDPRAGQWHEASLGGEMFGLVSPLSGGGYILHQRRIESAGRDSRTILWRQDEEITLPNANPNEPMTGPGIYFAGEDPSGSVILLMTLGDPGLPDHYWLVERDQCGAHNCDLKPLKGPVFWSPSGRRTIIVDTSSAVEWTRSSIDNQAASSLYLGNGLGEPYQEIGQGAHPFWLSEQRFGYMALIEGSGDREEEIGLSLGSITGPTRQAVLSSSELIEYVPVNQQPDTLYMKSVQASVADSDRLVITASSSVESRTVVSGYVFIVDMADEYGEIASISLVYQSSALLKADFSPDGRWLALSGGHGPGNVVHLIDLQTGKQSDLGSDGRPLSWTADGRWVAQRHRQYLSLFAPAHDYHHLSFRDLADCRSADWFRQLPKFIDFEIASDRPYLSDPD